MGLNDWQNVLSESKNESQSYSIDDYLDQERWLLTEIEEVMDSEIDDLKRKEYQLLIDRFRSDFEKLRSNTFADYSDIQKAREDLKTRLDSSYKLKDLLENYELRIKQIEFIENNYSDLDWYDEFIWLLTSDEVSLEQKYQLLWILNSKDIIDDYWLEELPTNIEDLIYFIEEIVKDYWYQDELLDWEIQEVLSLNDDYINWLWGNELNYLLNKIDYLLWTEENLDEEYIKWLKSKKLDIKTLLEAHNEEEINDKIEVKKDEKEINKLMLDKISNLHKSIDFEDIPNSEFWIKFKELVNKFQITDDYKEKNKLLWQISILLSSWGLKELMEFAKEKWWIKYSRVYKYISVVATSTNNQVLSQALKSYPPTLSDINPLKTIVPEYDKATTEIFLWWEDNMTMNWDNMINFEEWKWVDFSKHPPEYFYFNQDTWYRLDAWDMEIDDQIILDIRWEMDDLMSSMIEVKQLYTEKSKKYQDWLDRLELMKQNWEEWTENYYTLERELKQLERELNDLMEEYEWYKDEYFAKNEEMKHEIEKQENAIKWVTKEREKIRKDMLSFIHRIWFDLIPQEITEDLFEMIRSNQIPVSDIRSDFNPENIDLANWHFWESEWVDQNNIAKENLIRFLNKLITWDPDIDVTWIADDVVFNNQASIDPMTLKANMQEYWVYSVVLWFNKVKIQANLLSSPVKKDKEEK